MYIQSRNIGLAIVMEQTLRAVFFNWFYSFIFWLFSFKPLPLSLCVFWWFCCSLFVFNCTSANTQYKWK